MSIAALGIALTVGASGSSAALRDAQQTAPMTWSPSASMGTGRYGLALAAANGRLYAMAGNSQSGGDLSVVEEYNPGTNSWRQMGSRLFGGSQIDAATGDDGMIYAFVSGSGVVGRVYRYNPATDELVARAAMPHQSNLPRAAALGGKIYVTGFDSPATQVYAYDPAADSWELTSHMPAYRLFHGMAASNGRLYLVGGSTTNGDSQELIEYDLAADQWCLRSPMPTARRNLAAVAAGGRLYAIGGGNWDINDQVEEYDIATDSWSAQTRMSTARGNPGAATLSGRVHVAGGWTISGGAWVDHASAESAALPAAGSGQPPACQAVVPATATTTATTGTPAPAGTPIGTTTATRTPTVTPTGTPATQYSVSINGGASFTNTTAVTVTFSARHGTTEMQVSNDGGFDGAGWEPLATTKAWTITQHGSYVIPRIVYVRFRDASGVVSATSSDDIVLDVMPPSGSVQVASAGSGRAGLSLSASDDVSGVAEMQVSTDGGFIGANWQAYTTTTELHVGSSPAVYARFRDQAGNVSARTSAVIASASDAVPTVTVSVPESLPPTIPTPDTTMGGQVVVVPTVEGTAVAVIVGGPGSPFVVSLIVPAPHSSESPIGVRMQPQAALPSGVTAPSGVSVAKVVVIDVYDTRSGALIHDHSAKPLELSITLTADERTVCESDPGRIALLHIDQGGAVTRAPIRQLDCTSGTLRARLLATSAYGLAKLSHSLLIPLRAFVPLGLRSQVGG